MTETSERPKGSSLQPLRALLPYIRPYMGTLYLAMATLLLASAAQLTLPIAVRYLIDAGLLAENAPSIDKYFLGLFVAAMAFGLFSALRFYLVTWLGERVVADIRSSVYEHVVRQDPTFFEVTKTGEVLSRLTTDTTLIQSISGAGFSIALRASLNLVGAVIMSKVGRDDPVVVAARHRADHPYRSARAHSFENESGQGGRYERPRRRNPECNFHGAGLHDGTSAKRALQ